VCAFVDGCDDVCCDMMLCLLIGLVIVDLCLCVLMCFCVVLLVIFVMYVLLCDVFVFCVDFLAADVGACVVCTAA